MTKSNISFREYQKLAASTMIYPKEHKIFYPALGISAEVGEFNNKIKKKMRDNAELNLEDLKGELGDILWYLSALSTDLGLDLEEIASKNIEKLLSRKERGTLKGSGDNR